jgi:hypothetical protein
VLSDLLVVYPAGFLNLSSIREFWEVGKDFPAIHTRLIASELETQLTNGPTPTPMLKDEKIYYRDAFNPETEDITTNISTKDNYSLSFILGNDYSFLELWKNIQYLNRYNDFVQSKNAKAYFLYPATAQIGDEQTRSILNKTTDLLKKDLHLPIIGSWEDSQFTTQYLFDTEYHLNADGRTIHTNRLIAELCSKEIGFSCK